MARALDISEQVETASELAYRAEVYHTTWFAIASRDDRASFAHAFDDHAEILMIMQGTAMTSLIVTLHNLFALRDDTVNLPRISRQMKDLGRDQLSNCAAAVTKVARLRHNVYAHRSGKLTIPDSFRLAAISGNDMRFLANRAMSLCRVFSHELRLPNPQEPIGAKAVIHNLLAALNRDASAGR
ncbi:MAG: hypothetical protein ABIU10_09935 [Sphingomicrobium sp.]